MRIALGVLINTKAMLEELSTLRMKAKDAFKVLSALRKIGEEIKIYEDTKMKLIKTYGIKDDKGGFSISEDNENYNTVIAELNELSAKEVELDIEKLSIDSLGDNEIEIYKLNALSYIFDI